MSSSEQNGFHLESVQHSNTAMGGLVGTIVKPWRSVFVGGLWLLAMACQPNEDTRPTPPETAVDLFCLDEALPEVEQTPSWDEDVSTLLGEHCVTCHQAGGIAPMALDTPEDANKWAELLSLIHI